MTKTFTSLALCLVLFATVRLSAQAIFTDAYATGVTFAGFGGAVNAVTIDNTTNQSGTASLKIVVPATAYAGGAFVAATPQNLTTYNAVSFWIKGSVAKTLDKAGLGNNAATAVYFTELEKIAITTTWTKVIVPIPLATKLTAETGLFHFAEGSDEGAYTIWLDNIQYENLATTVIGVPTAAIATETIAKSVGDVFESSDVSSTFPVNGASVKLKTSKSYLTFTSATPTVATVSALGVVTAAGVGTSAITAKLGAINATGTLTVNVTAATAPTTAAPTPTRSASSVISLYSKLYTNVTGIDWFPNWGQSTKVTDIVIAGDSTKKYSDLNYQGVQFTGDLNVSTMNYLHIDFWTPNITSLKLFLINTNPAPTVEQVVTLTPTLAGWNGFNIPLSSFPNIKMDKIGQFKFESVPFGGATAFMDNIYFFKTGVGTNDVSFAKNLFTLTPSISDASFALNLTENVKGSTQITLSNISGQSVYNQSLTTNGTALTHAISTKSLPNGIYVVSVSVGTTVQTEKVIVAH